MKTRILLLLNIGLPAIVLAPSAWPSGMHDPLITHLELEHLEWQSGGESDDDDLLALGAQFWSGYDRNRFWAKTDIEQTDGETEEAELQLLYSRAISSYWNFQTGIRRDFHPEPAINWGVVGFQGLAPYFFDVETALFIGEQGRTALRVSAEYELPITQRWFLSPEIELNAYGQNEPEYRRGSGLADAALDLRLRYEIRREFAPYVGIHVVRQFGNTADYLEAAGENSHDTRFTLGLQAWF